VGDSGGGKWGKYHPRDYPHRKESPDILTKPNISPQSYPHPHFFLHPVIASCGKLNCG